MKHNINKTLNISHIGTKMLLKRLSRRLCQ